MAEHVSIRLLADFTRCQAQNVEISHTTDNYLSERIEITGKDINKVKDKLRIAIK